MKLSLLNFGAARYDRTIADALWGHIELAQLAESLGYARYWITEHRTTNGAYGASPILVGTLAGVTDTIRVGSAGVLLRYEAPYRVAEDFKLLEALYPGRIDAGVCAGAAPPDVVRELLLGREESSLPTFTERATSLEGFLRGASAPSPAPHLPRRAPLWILSGGGDSVVLAGRLSASLSLTVMHSSAGRQSPESVRRYLDAHAGEREPGWNVAVAGVCAETHAEAVALAAEHEDRFIHPTVVGAPHEVAEKLAALADAYSTDEIVFCDVAPSRDARHRSLQLIAEACGVGRRTAAPSANSDAGSHDAAR